MRRLNTLFVGREFHELPRIASTNEYAVDLLSKSKPADGTVIYTPNQYAGRGQIGSRWESEADKNINLSVILYPSFLPAHRQFLLNQTIALAVLDLINKFLGEKVSIKWPNDIYVADNKIAGILIQNTVSGSHFKNSVAGIGINVNQENFPSALSNPTSLYNETRHRYDCDVLIPELCHSIELRYLQLKSGNTVSLHRDYLDNLYRLQVSSQFKRPNGETFTGMITGIDDSGQLVVESEYGKKSFGLKEISFC